MHGRTLGRTALVAAFAVALALAATGSALAAPPSSQQAIVQYGNDACGGEIMGAPTIGTATFLHKGNQLWVTYEVYDGDANTDYEVFVHDGDTCLQIGAPLGTFTTDGDGDGRLRGRVKVKGYSVVYATGLSAAFGGLPNNSLAVALP